MCKKKSSVSYTFFDASKPLVIGHRGAAGTMPENTIPSFDQALQDGADVLETDLHLTKDGAVVLLHDSVLDRVTDGSGPVENYTLAELKKLDAAYRFSTDGGKTFPFRGKGVAIPTLEEVFDRYQGVKFNIDLKSKDPALITRALDIIKKKGRGGLTVLASFNGAAVKELHRQQKKAGLDILVCAPPNRVIGFIVQSKLHLPDLSPPFVLETPLQSNGINVVTKNFVKYAHAKGHFVAPWVINDPKEMAELLKMGVDGIITDYPGRAAEVIKKFKRA